MLHRLSISDLQAICDRYENLQKNLPPAMSMGSEEYRYARATLDRIQKQKEAEGHSTQILQMVHRIDQHLDVVEEKIDGAPVQSPEITRQLETQLREMETMKAMMEAMRLERVRQEQEAKKKAEEEAAAAKLRAEQEEASALAVFRKESEMKLHSLLHQNQGQYCRESLGGCGPLFFQMNKTGEILLEFLYGTGMGIPVEYEFIITDHHIYYVVCTKNGYSNTQFKHIGKLYSFHAPLNSSQCKLLKSALASTDCPTQIPLKTRICYNIFPATGQPTIPSELAYHRKKFESIVRLIPGAYQNGDWRQLDGFFGMYYNETTMDVSEYPPSL